MTVIKRVLLEFRKRYPIKERIFFSYMFFFAVLSFFTIFANILNGFDFIFNYKWIVIGLFSLSLLVLAFRRHRVKLIHRIGIYTLTLILLSASGLTSSGLVSPGIMYSFLLFILINYNTKGWERIFLDISVILINMALVVLFRFQREIFTSLTAQGQFMDWIVTVPVVSGFIIILLIAFEKAYETERIMNEKKSRELERLSQTDYLTGLYNRAHLDEKLAFLHDVYLRTKNPYSIIMMDIDYFKAYNDLYGHPDGDTCLQIFGSRLKKRINRTTDWAYRYGGEEFLVLLGFSDAKGAEVVAKQIQQDLAREAVPHGGSIIHDYVTVSIGIATVMNENQTPEAVLKSADQALYHSKENGRNCISLFE